MKNDKPDKLIKDLESLSIELDNLADLGPSDNLNIDNSEDNLSPDEFGHQKAELESAAGGQRQSIEKPTRDNAQNNQPLHHELLVTEIVEQSLPAIELQLKTRLRAMTIEEIEGLYNSIHAKR